MNTNRLERLQDCFENAMDKFILAEHTANHGNNPYKLDEVMRSTRISLMRLRTELQRAIMEEGK